MDSSRSRYAGGNRQRIPARNFAFDPQPREAWFVGVGMHDCKRTSVAALVLASIPLACRSPIPPTAVLELGGDAGVELRSGRDDPRTLRWYEARETSAQRVLTSFLLVLFDDVNGNRLPDPGEVLVSDHTGEQARPASVLRLRSLVDCRPAARVRLLALARVATTTCPRGREVVWTALP